MNIVELFCGTKSFAKVAQERGHNIFTTDKNPIFKPTICCDILSFNPKTVPFKVDVLWASPPCTFFSVASIGKHWYPDHRPKTAQAQWGMIIVRKTL